MQRYVNQSIPLPQGPPWGGEAGGSTGSPTLLPIQNGSQDQILSRPLISLSCLLLSPYCPFSLTLLGARGQLSGAATKGYSAVTSLLLDKLCKLS